MEHFLDKDETITLMSELVVKSGAIISVLSREHYSRGEFPLNEYDIECLEQLREAIDGYLKHRRNE